MKTLLDATGAFAGIALFSGILLFTAKTSPAETLLYQFQESNSGLTQLKNSSTMAPVEDSSSIAQPGTLKGTVVDNPNELVSVSEPVFYIATAYSLRGRTASGRYVSSGIIAADPRILPLGSRVRLEAGPWSGEYLVADTGGRIKGRKIDIWTPTAREALRFGRRKVKLTVLSYGGRRSAAKKRVQT